MAPHVERSAPQLSALSQCRAAIAAADVLDSIKPSRTLTGLPANLSREATEAVKWFDAHPLPGGANVWSRETDAEVVESLRAYLARRGSNCSSRSAGQHARLKPGSTASSPFTGAEACRCLKARNISGIYSFGCAACRHKRECACLRT